LTNRRYNVETGYRSKTYRPYRPVASVDFCKNDILGALKVFLAFAFSVGILGEEIVQPNG
jgi:hypothetical protein